MTSRFVVSLIAALVSLPALGQEPIPQSFLEKLARDLAAIQQTEGSLEGFSVRVINDQANVHSGASLDTRIVGNLNEGAKAMAIEKSGDWYGVILPGKGFGWIQERNVTPVSGSTSGDIFYQEEILPNPDEPGWVEKRILILLERAAGFKKAYQDNPYVTVRGFDISLSLTGPSLGMSFEFKE